MRSDFLHREFNLDSDDAVEVTVDGPANVMLLDQANYDQYLRGESFQYHGGLAERSPVNLVPTHPGPWHVVVDLGGYSGRIRAGVRVLQGVSVAR